MSGNTQPSVRIVWHEVAVIERFSSVLYPFDIIELLRQLPTNGYVVPELVTRGTPEAGKPLASKGDIELVVNQDNKTIGVRGRDPEAAVASFQELRKFYMEQLDPSPGLATHYIELNCSGWAKSGANPVEALSRFWASFTRLSDLGAIIGADTTNFGLQLAPPNHDPNDPSWFHIYIEPLTVSSSDRYRVRCVWRGTELERLLVKFSRIDETLQRLISKIEGG